jgi:hypothetical protein
MEGEQRDTERGGRVGVVERGSRSIVTRSSRHDGPTTGLAQRTSRT